MKGRIRRAGLALYSTPMNQRPTSPPVVRTREIAGFELREARYDADFAGSPHRHPLPYFGYVLEGDFIERTPRGRARFAGGSLHFHPAGDLHAGIVGGNGARCFSILPGARLSGRLDAAPGPGLIDGESPRLAALAARCHEAFLARDSASDLACESVALELVAAALRLRSPCESAAPGWLFVARDYLHAHWAEPVTLAGLSAAAGVHPVHLVRVFRRTLGVTPAGFVRRLRLEQACRTLATTDLPIAQVALAAGYSSQSHLTRAFRAHTGATPAAYRRARRPRSA